jgi:alcohol dehydrogenase class IV
MQFEFATAERILFGPGQIEETAPAARRFGKHAMVVVGKTPERAAHLLEQLHKEDVETTLFQVRGEPTVEVVREGVTLARGQKIDLVVGLGGGSVLDAGKAIASLTTNPGDVLDYLEVIGRGQSIKHASIPFVAIPTTSGTGAEVTRNAVLASPEHKVKVSLRSPLMLPRLAIVDPGLTIDLLPEVTATTGFDALTQLIEPFISNAANPLTDSLCREGIRRIARSLQRACEHGDDTEAREDMSLASLFGGMALANARLGAVHGLAGPIGGMYSAPHGAICARLLPFAMETNLHALRQRSPRSVALARLEEVAHLLTMNPGAQADDAIIWLKELGSNLNIPPLSTYNMNQPDISVIVGQAMKASSMRGNPIELTEEELSASLERAI